jgi:hypothetical protein
MKTFIVLFVVLGLCSSVQAELIGQWKLDGNMLDSVGTNNGTAMDGPLTYVLGAPNGADAGGQAGQFGGSVRVNVGSDSSLQPTTALSYSCWIKVQEPLSDTWQHMWRRDTPGKPRTLFAVGTWAGDVGLWLGIRTTTYVELVGTVSDAEMRDGNWHLAVGTYDSSVSGQDNMFLYWDGQVVGSMRHSGTIPVFTRDATIGGRVNGTEPFIGSIDDFRVYNHALSAAEVGALFSGLDPKASSPQPRDKDTDVERKLTLSWTPGVYAEKHNVYFGTDLNSVRDANKTNHTGLLEFAENQDANSYPVSGLLDYGTTYYWKINEVNSAPDHYIYEGKIWQFATELYAYPITDVTVTASSEYDPSRGAKNTVNGSGLADDLHSNIMTDMWLSGIEPAGAWIKYEFGAIALSNGSFESPVLSNGWTSRAAFDNWIFSLQGGGWWGGRNIPEGVPAYDGNQLLDLINCVASQYVPIPGGIQPNTTYEFSVYAREYPGHPAGEMQIWISWDNDDTLPVEDDFGSGRLTVTDSWAKYTLTLDTSVQAGAIGHNYLVVEVQSYNEEVLFDNAELVLGGGSGRVYKLYQMWAWNFNDEFNYNFGLKDVNIEYSVDSNDWKALAGVPQFARAKGQPNYTHETEVDFGVAAKHVKLVANSSWGGGNQYGLSEVRFYRIPVRADKPKPEIGQLVTNLDGVLLSWKPGREAASHDVYLDTSRGTTFVNNVTVNSYNTGPLQLGTTYYWKIDEVNENESPNVWDGPVWNFTTPSYLVVDDMESYGEADVLGQPGSRIWYTWKDGEGWSSPLPSYGGNGTGSVVDLSTGFAHEGGKALAYYYDNDGTNYLGTPGKAYYSEITANIDDLAISRNWTKGGAKILSLQFYGDPNNDAGGTEKMYVKLNNSRVEYYGDTSDIQEAWWHTWLIDLDQFGIDLSNVTSISIGFGNKSSTTAGGKGVVFFDSIRLLPSGCYPDRDKPLADIAGASGIGEGNYDCKVDYWDLAVLAADWLKEDYRGIDLRGDWKLDGDATDSSRWGNHGIDVNAVYVEGKYGQAVELSSGSYIYVPDESSLDPAWQITISAWIKPNDLPVDRESHLYRKDAAGRRQLLAFWRQGAPPALPGQVAVALGLSWADGGYDELEIVTNITDWIDGNWHLVTGTYDRSVMRIYRDGVLLGSPLPHTGGLADNSGDAYLGSYNGDDWLDGGLDDVRLYGVALTDTQVAQLAAGNEPTGYTPVDSVAELFKAEPEGQRSIDFKDFATLADEWLQEVVWP